VKNLSENAYCLTCHSRDIRKTLADGETISLKVDSLALMHSVHKNFKCSQCHTGYSKTSHPVKEYKSLADFRKAGNEICGKCHTSELRKYHKSIHYAKRVSGDSSAPDCLSCHGYHNVEKVLADKKLSKAICTRCHKEEGEAFKDSIHAKSLACASCHDAHEVKAVKIADLDKSCVKCHQNLEGVHAEWLHNPPFQEKTFVKMHFEKASCAACHAKAEKEVVLSVVDRKTGRPYQLKQDLIKKFDLNKDGMLEQKELWELMAYLKQKENVTLDGKIDVSDKNAAHKILSKNFALRNCAGCHNPSANFKVTLEKKVPVERAAINSFNIIPNMRNFYAIGLTKVRILDIIFVLAVLAGLGFAFGHIGLRIITTPIRRKRREGK
jgi:predicted CXXCH cytochrome family protein